MMQTNAHAYTYPVGNTPSLSLRFPVENTTWRCGYCRNKTTRSSAKRTRTSNAQMYLSRMQKAAQIHWLRGATCVKAIQHNLMSMFPTRENRIFKPRGEKEKRGARCLLKRWSRALPRSRAKCCRTTCLCPPKLRCLAQKSGKGLCILTNFVQWSCANAYIWHSVCVYVCFSSVPPRKKPFVQVWNASLMLDEWIYIQIYIQACAPVYPYKHLHVFLCIKKAVISLPDRLQSTCTRGLARTSICTL